MIRYHRTHNEADETYVSGKRGTRLVTYNGSDYSIMRWNQHLRAWHDYEVEHVKDYLLALNKAEEFVK